MRRAGNDMVVLVQQLPRRAPDRDKQEAQGGDAPSAWPNNARLQDVPFDVTRNQALTLAGTGVFDVMTYCGTPNNTWPMPARWDRLWTEIGS